MPRPDRVWTPLLVLHAAMMAQPILFGVIAFVAADAAAGGTPPASRGTLIAIAAGVAGALAAATPMVRARLMPRRERAGDGRPVDEARLADPHARAALGRLRVALLVSWAMTEAVALCGLVPAFILHDVRVYAPFGAIALFLMLVYAPRPRLLVQILDALPHA